MTRNGRAVAGTAARLRRQASAEPGQRVLLMHGLAGNHRVWQAWEERAAAHLELWDAILPWAVDGTPGWAEDPDPGAWIVRAMESVPAIDVIMAHSFAATTLLEVLARPGTAWPRAVVLVSPFYRARPSDFDWQQLAHTLDDFSRLIEEGIGIYARHQLRPEVRADMACHIRDRIGPQGWLRFMDMYLRTPRFAVHRLTLPVLVVCGQHDASARPSDTQALAGSLPNCRAEIFPDSGHFPMISQPGRYTGLVHEFLGVATRAAPSGAALHAADSARGDTP